jgi:hypothetical protein
MAKFCNNTIEVDSDCDCVILVKSAVLWHFNQSTHMNVRSTRLITRNAGWRVSAREMGADATSIDAKVRLFQYDFARLLYNSNRRSVRQRLT